MQIFVHSIDGVEPLHGHLLVLHFPLHLHFVSFRGSCDIDGWLEAMGSHFSFSWIQPYWRGSQCTIVASEALFHSKACNRALLRCCLNAEGVGGSFSPSAIFFVKRYWPEERRYYLRDDHRGFRPSTEHQRELTFNVVCRRFFSRIIDCRIVSQISCL